MIPSSRLFPWMGIIPLLVRFSITARELVPAWKLNNIHTVGDAILVPVRGPTYSKSGLLNMILRLVSRCIHSAKSVI
jgi:hypothetical protein